MPSSTIAKTRPLTDGAEFEADGRSSTCLDPAEPDLYVVIKAVGLVVRLERVDRRSKNVGELVQCGRPHLLDESPCDQQRAVAGRLAKPEVFTAHVLGRVVTPPAELHHPNAVDSVRRR